MKNPVYDVELVVLQNCYLWFFKFLKIPRKKNKKNSWKLYIFETSFP